MADLDIQELARLTQEVVVSQKYALSEMKMQDSPRMRVVLTLLVACMDHAASAALLLHHQADTCGVSAMTLVRPQVEAFCRAIMFSVDIEVSDQEVRAFTERDELPQRTPANGGRKKDIFARVVQEIAIKEVNSMAEGYAENGGVITRFVQFEEEELHSFIHGGAALLHMYDLGPDGIGHSMSNDTARRILYHMAMLSMLALSFAGERLASPSESDFGPLSVAWPGFIEQVERMS